MIDQAQPETEAPPEVGRPGLARPRRRPSPRAIVAMAVLGGAVFLMAVAQRALIGPPAPQAAPAEAGAGPQKLVARGQVRSIAYARVGTLSGGVVNRLAIEVGDPVNEQQEIARVRGPGGTELLTSPLRGTVTAILVRLGDTVIPGTTIATVGDLSRLQVETTDVDEFLIAHVRKGQRVAVTVEALGREFPGEVRTVALEPTVIPPGDEHYPVAIDLLETAPELRPGMTVRLRFLEGPMPSEPGQPAQGR